MENVVIQFIGDTSQLDDSITLLEKIGKLSKEEADLARKSAQASGERTKAIQAQKKSALELGVELSKEKKSLEDLNKASKNLDNTIKAAFSNEIISRFDAEFQKLPKSMQEAIDKTNTLKKDFAEGKALLQKMIQAGQEGTPEFKKLSNQVAEINDQLKDSNDLINILGSDTKTFDSLINVAQGAVGAFTAVQGAVGLFASENKELEKTLLKVNSAMAVLQGLQSVQQVLTDKATQATLRQVFVQGLYNTVVGTSTGVLKVFRIALAATGIGFVILLLASLVLNWDKVVIAFKKGIAVFNELGTGFKTILAFVSPLLGVFVLIYNQVDKLIAKFGGFNRMLAAFKGAITSFVSDFASAFVEFNKNLTNPINAFKTFGQRMANSFNKGLEEGVKEYDLNKLLEDKIKSTQIRVDDNKRELARIEAQGKETFSLKKKILQDEVFLLRQEANKADEKNKEDAIKAVKDKENEISVLNIEYAKKQKVRRLTDTKADIDARLLLVEKGSKQELDLQIDSLIAQSKIELNNTEITANQRKLIEAKLLDDINKLNRDYADLRLSNELDIINRKLNITKEGSAEELNLKIEQLKKSAQIELLNETLNVEQRRLIEDNLQKNILELKRNYGNKIADEALQIAIENNNAYLAIVKEGTLEELRAKQETIELAEQAQIDSINQTEKNEELRQAKIKRVLSEGLKQRQQLEDEYYKKQLNDSFQRLDTKAADDIGNSRLKKPEGDSFVSEANRRRLIELEILKNTLDEKRSLNHQYFLDGKIAEEEYLKNKEDLNKQNNKALKEISDQEAANNREAILAKTEFALESLAKVLEFAQQAIQQKLDNEIQAIDTARDRDLSALDERKEKGLINEESYNAQKAIIQKHYQEQERKAKIKAAEEQKKLNVFQALINGALAVTNILATSPAPIAPFLIAASIATTAAQVAFIASRPIPKFAKGVKVLDGPGTETSDSITANLSKGERVVPAGINKKYFDFLNLVHDEKISPDQANSIVQLVKGVKVPELPSHMKVLINNNNNPIDYEKFGKVVGEEIAKIPINNINMDEQGFVRFTQKGKTKTIFVKSKYA